MADYEYMGDNRAPTIVHEDAYTTKEYYDADDDLRNAVNIAIYLRRPLLIEGEAGCGKSRLARSVAYELGLPLFVWNIRSTTKAREGLYEYDALLRLHDVNVKQKDADSSLPRDPSDATQYRRFGALGKAFRTHDCPAVVLIDEIDKADVDFPNDLLTVLEPPWEFTVPETGEPSVKADENNLPIIIITSNKEKGNLPDPFLRRCVYHYIQFPKDDMRLKKIVDLYYESKKKKQPDKNLIHEAINRFTRMRKNLGLHKQPGTSELLDWIDVMGKQQDKEDLASRLSDDNKTIPYPGLLYKRRDDWQRNVYR